MARSGQMDGREVSIHASAILAAYGELTADYVIDQLSDAPGDRIVVRDWCWVSTSMDFTANSSPQ